MIRWLSMFIALTITFCVAVPLPNAQANSSKGKVTLTIHTFDKKPYVSMFEMKTKLAVKLNYNEAEGTIQFAHAGSVYRLMRGTTTISRDGLFLPVDAKPYLQTSKKAINIYLPLVVAEQAIGLTVQSKTSTQITLNNASKPKTADVVFGSALYKPTRAINVTKATPAQLVTHLAFLQSPIQGAKVSTRDSHLPGAARAYRNGIHEGLDWYSDYSAVKINKQTQVKSSANGVVVRIDANYVEYKAAERDRELKIAKQSKQTPAYILDRLRGRTVWVQHEKGVLVRYAHLSKVNPGLKIGSAVKTGDWLGNVGNSGTSSGVAGSNEDLHLHMDILIYEQMFWQHLSKAQIRFVLSQVF